MRDDRSGATPEQPFQPEIPRSHFARGLAHHRYGEELPLGRFSEGLEELPGSPEHYHRGRFSEGQELTGEADPQKHIRRRFSEGLEHRVSGAEGLEHRDSGAEGLEHRVSAA